MTTPREMTMEELERAQRAVKYDHSAESLAEHLCKSLAHIAALEARAERAETALEAEEREHAETRAMHSQLAQVCMQHQRDRDNARDAALEEAAQVIECGCDLQECRQNAGPQRIRALKTQPARRFVPLDEVRVAPLSELLREDES